MDQTDVKNFFSLEDFPFQDLFEGCGAVWEVVKKISHYLEKKNLGKIDVAIPEGVHLVNPSLISIGKGSIIEPGAYIKGPCLIGENCEVRHGAYIRGNVILGKKCVVGHATEVKNSIFLNGAKAPHFNYVGDTVLGARTNLGAGVICANLRLDEKPISIYIEGAKHETGLKKLGLILGDDAQVGCNCVTNPGTIVGKGALCLPSQNFGGWVAAGARIGKSNR